MSDRKPRWHVMVFDKDAHCWTDRGGYRWRWLAEWMSGSDRRMGFNTVKVCRGDRWPAEGAEIDD